MRVLRALSFAVVTVGMYLALPFVGWGVDDVRGFLDAPQRAGYAALVALLAVAVGLQARRSPEGIRGGRGRREARVARQSVVRVAAVFLLYLALSFLPFADRRSLMTLADAGWVRWLGLALAATGLVWIMWSGLALGRLYSPEVTLQDGHRLVTDGPYRLIRHPRYLDALALGLGLSLLFRSWFGLLGTAGFLALILYRISDEERLMANEFGPEWEAYRQRSWRLIPHLY
jgi:protein-S-isoprenylcysteine O-methyltransferase Ste14